MRICLVGCSSSKKDYTTNAEDLYSKRGQWKLKMKAVRATNPDKIYILSGLHGLVELDDILEPYDFNLPKQSKEYKLEWSNKVIHQLINKGVDFENDEILIFGGIHYYQYLINHFKNAKVIGEKLRMCQLTRLYKQIYEKQVII